MGKGRFVNGANHVDSVDASSSESLTEMSKYNEIITLPDGHQFIMRNLPDDLMWSDAGFESCWEQRPDKPHPIFIHGRTVPAPRLQQAYGSDYEYTGSKNNALPIPHNLWPLLAWGKQQFDSRLNGMLLNWYESPDQYIGAHHDSTKGMFDGSPIVTISFGETRIFRLTRWEQRKKVDTFDLSATPGRVVVIPYETNKAWKHEVVKRRSYVGRRISVTLRAFEVGVLPDDQYRAQ